VESTSESALVQRARAGDERALGELFARHRAKLRTRVLRQMSRPLRRKISASDILQEAELVAHRRLAEFEDRGEGSFGRWLGRIVTFKTREAVKHYTAFGKRTIAREVSRAGSRSPEAGHANTPSRVAIARETRRRFEQALRRLPAAQREVMLLLQEQNYTIAETARRMGRSEGAVKKLYARALARLREQIEDAE
jgi:RNA polymerase sigma-70 factor (ECF subfamily)